MSKFRTSREVYDQIRWDTRFRPSEVLIDYETRTAGDSEISFEAFDPNGDIPWHRVQRFRTTDGVIWDRRARIDNTHSFAARGLAREMPAARPVATFSGALAVPTDRPPMVERQSFAFFPDAQAWTQLPKPGPAPKSLKTLSFLTYNLQSSDRDAEPSARDERLPALVDLIARSEAEVIALQEVSPVAWRALLARPEIRRYTITRPPEDPTLGSQGVALLSLLPVLRVVEHPFSRHKRFWLAELKLPEGSLVAVSLHFTSDMQPGATDTRAEQWRWLIDEVLANDPAVQAGARVVLLGDFNAEDTERTAWAPAFPGHDAWSSLHPDDPGYTFDTLLNGTAARTCQRARRARLDSIYLSQGFKAQEAARRGEKPLNALGLCASDHFGLWVRAALDTAPARLLLSSGRSLRREPPVVRSALTCIPPRSLWAPLQEIRRHFDPAFARWMPHLNVLYGFLAEGAFPEATRQLSEAFRDEEPFSVTLSGLRQFTHTSSLTVWVAPDEEGRARLERLYRKAAALFPGCVDPRHGAETFNPHLTIAKFPRNEQDKAARLMAEWQKQLPPLTFTVEGLHLISRRGEEPFAPRAFAPLSAPWPSEKHQETFALVSEACAAVLSPAPASVVRVGSCQLGTAREQSDLDLVCLGPPEVSREDFFSGLRLVLQSDVWIERLRVASGALVPALKAERQGVNFDLLYANAPKGSPAHLSEWTAADLARVSPEDQRTASAYFENQAMLDLARMNHRQDVFRDLLGRVTHWAKARRLYGNRFGFLGGYSWAVLVSAYLESLKDDSAPLLGLLRGFFSRYADWPWPAPVLLARPGEPTPKPEPLGARDLLPIFTVGPWAKNTVRNACPSTVELLRREWTRAADILKTTKRDEAGREERAAQAVSPQEHPGPRLGLRLETSYEPEREEAAGWIEAHLIGAFLSLEKAGFRVRPFPPAEGDEPYQWEIGLAPEREGFGPPSREAAFAAMTTFTGGFAQARPNASMRLLWID
jgi:poly(A) polymerase